MPRMSKQLIAALLLIALVVAVALFNQGHMKLDLLATEFKILKSAALLFFTAVGIVIGALIK